jgi:hypothetical protein
MKAPCIALLLLTMLTMPLLANAASVQVSRSQFKGDWPLTVESGTLSCEPFRAVPSLQLVTFSSKGTTYAVNGTARGQAKKRGWLEIDPIWRKDPSAPGLKVNIGPLIDRGLALCK